MDDVIIRLNIPEHGIRAIAFTGNLHKISGDQFVQIQKNRHIHDEWHIKRPS